MSYQVPLRHSFRPVNLAKHIKTNKFSSNFESNQQCAMITSDTPPASPEISQNYTNPNEKKRRVSNFVKLQSTLMKPTPKIEKIPQSNLKTTSATAEKKTQNKESAQSLHRYSQNRILPSSTSKDRIESTVHSNKDPTATQGLFKAKQSSINVPMAVKETNKGNQIQIIESKQPIISNSQNSKKTISASNQPLKTADHGPHLDNKESTGIPLKKQPDNTEIKYRRILTIDGIELVPIQNEIETIVEGGNHTLFETKNHNLTTNTVNYAGTNVVPEIGLKIAVESKQPNDCVSKVPVNILNPKEKEKENIPLLEKIFKHKVETDKLNKKTHRKKDPNASKLSQRTAISSKESTETTDSARILNNPTLGVGKNQKSNKLLQSQQQLGVPTNKIATPIGQNIKASAFINKSTDIETPNHKNQRIVYNQHKSAKKPRNDLDYTPVCQDSSDSDTLKKCPNAAATAIKKIFTKPAVSHQAISPSPSALKIRLVKKSPKKQWTTVSVPTAAKPVDRKSVPTANKSSININKKSQKRQRECESKPESNLDNIKKPRLELRQNFLNFPTDNGFDENDYIIKSDDEFHKTFHKLVTISANFWSQISAANQEKVA